MVLRLQINARRYEALRKGIIRVNPTSNVKSALFQVNLSCAPLHFQYEQFAYIMIVPYWYDTTIKEENMTIKITFLNKIELQL